MKTIFISLSVASLLAAVIALSGQSLDFPSALAVAFTAGLTGWTFAEYTRDVRSLDRPRLLRPGLSDNQGNSHASVRRVA